MQNLLDLGDGLGRIWLVESPDQLQYALEYRIAKMSCPLGYLQLQLQRGLSVGAAALSNCPSLFKLSRLPYMGKVIHHRQPKPKQLGPLARAKFE